MTEQTVPSAGRVEWAMRLIALTCVEREREFSDLDAVVGDGDFGYSLARGFENVIAEWDGFDRSDAGTFLQGVAMTMSRRIGGTSGPIWSTAVLRAATTARGMSSPTGSDVVAMLRAAIAGIQARGGAEPGDKTLLDALVPLADEVERGVAEAQPASAVARRAAAAADEGAEATRAMTARRGRAAYSGERSVGVIDPGAVAIAVIAGRIADEWDGAEDGAAEAEDGEKESGA